MCDLVLTCSDTHFEYEPSGVGFVSLLSRHWLPEEQTWWGLAANGFLFSPNLYPVSSKAFTSLVNFISYNGTLN